jgi:hypothetical protein
MNDVREGVDNELLPAWFTERMMGEEWLYGLLTVAGDIVAIRRINKITRDAAGHLWLDVRLAAYNEANGVYDVDNPRAQKVIVAPTERRDATVNAAHVVLAFEMWMR